MLERLRKEPKLPERVGVLHEQLAGGQPEFLEHRSGGLELRDTVGQVPGQYGYPGSVLSNDCDVQRAHLFGRAARWLVSSAAASGGISGSAASKSRRAADNRPSSCLTAPRVTSTSPSTWLSWLWRAIRTASSSNRSACRCSKA